MKANGDHAISRLFCDQLQFPYVQKPATHGLVKIRQAKGFFCASYAPVGCNRGFANLTPRQLHRVGSILKPANATETKSRRWMILSVLQQMQAALQEPIRAFSTKFVRRGQRTEQIRGDLEVQFPKHCTSHVMNPQPPAANELDLQQLEKSLKRRQDVKSTESNPAARFRIHSRFHLPFTCDAWLPAPPHLICAS